MVISSGIILHEEQGTGWVSIHVHIPVRRKEKKKDSGAAGKTYQVGISPYDLLAGWISRVVQYTVMAGVWIQVTPVPLSPMPTE